MTEVVTYNKAPRNTLNIEKSLELQTLILNPDTRPYVNTKNDERLNARSAGATTEKEQQQRLTIQQMLELRDKIIDNL